MYLRRLELKDAPLMLAWMHDSEVTKDLRSDFSSKTLNDAESFIINSWHDEKNVNLAVASEADEYMGTVSLKHIENGGAEFAITVRREAMNRGFSWFGMESIIEKAFNEYGLDRVYWCVSRKNKRAIRFYDKHNFKETFDLPKAVLDRYCDLSDLKWYEILKNDSSEKESVAGCRVIRIKTIAAPNAGELSFFEGLRNVPFDIKRIYFITKVPEGTRRGFHAHKKLKQFIFCPYGRIQLILDDGTTREEIELNDSRTGVIVDKCTWREMLWLQSDSVLCVAASDYYSADDYIRDYSEFKQFLCNYS